MKRVKVVTTFEVQGLWFDWFDTELLEIGIIVKDESDRHGPGGFMSWTIEV